MKKTPALLLAIFLIIAAAPALICGGVFLLNDLHARGLDVNPNFAGGKPLAAFPDASGDLTRALPAGVQAEDSGSLDVVAFSIRTQEFNPLSGFGMESRLNLVFDFRRKLMNAERSAAGFSLPGIIVLIDAPDRGEPAASVSAMKPDFIVLIDGSRGRARIFSADRAFIADGIDLFIMDSKTPPAPNRKPLQAGDRIVASLPLSVFGDITRGVWRFGWMAGFTDSGTAGNADMTAVDASDGNDADANRPPAALKNGARIILCPYPEPAARGRP